MAAPKRWTIQATRQDRGDGQWSAVSQIPLFLVYATNESNAEVIAREILTGPPGRPRLKNAEVRFHINAVQTG